VTADEARELIGSTVLWDGKGQVCAVKIAHVGVRAVFIQSRDGRPLPGKAGAATNVDPDELRVIPPSTLTSTQAALNELAADAFFDVRRLTDPQVELASEALRNLNWAAGFDFDGAVPPSGECERERCAEAAISLADQLWDRMERDDRVARYHATLVDADLARRLVGTRQALVYLVIHADLGAVKVGISEADGTRIAQHRRRGWQLVAAFLVTGKEAVSIERTVLKWWRVDLSLPIHVASAAMPQGGWTETVAAARIDLGATVARVCKLALP
jgi:hypothetical protein